MTDRVTMRLRGRMLEKFVDRAAMAGVRFEKVARTGEQEMTLTIRSAFCAQLLALAEEYRMDLTVTGEEGWPKVSRRLRERGTMTLGLMLGLAVIVLFTSRIWRVEAVSLDGMADDELLASIVQHAQRKGALPGTERNSLDRDALALDIQTQWPELTHVGVKLDGVYLRVEVAMEAAAPEVYDISASRDLVADRDAVIIRIEPLAGKAAVKNGDVVRRGQVLIRGEERVDTDVMVGVRALGQAIARVWFEASCDLPLFETLRERTGGVRTSSQLRLGSWTWTLSEAEDYPCQDVEVQTLPVGGLYLPVRIERVIRWEATEKTVPADAAQLYAQAEAWAIELARGRLPGSAEETGCWVDFTERGGILTARATIEARMNIAVERAALAGPYE